MNEGSRWASEWDNVTTLSPASAVALAVGTIAIFSVPRRFVFLPLLLVTSFVPISERLVILGMDFAFLRLMVVLCWARFLVRGEHSGFKWNRIDMVFAAWIAWRMLATLVRTGSLGSLVRHAGLSIDALGIYFLMRVLIRSWRDLDPIILTFAFVAIPVALSMTYETSTGWNFSSVFSDHLEGVAMSRGGAVRARIGYAHPLIAGAIWASVVPLLAARWWKPGSSRAFTFLSVVAAITCVWASSSSTPLLGLLIALVAAGAWVVRRHMNWVRWAILGALILLQLGMEKPIWHLFQRVTAIGISGSTGYHRYRLLLGPPARRRDQRLHHPGGQRRPRRNLGADRHVRDALQTQWSAAASLPRESPGDLPMGHGRLSVHPPRDDERDGVLVADAAALVRLLCDGRQRASAPARRS
jgi:hypothetical protein